MSDVEDTELEMKEKDTREIQKLKENLAKQVRIPAHVLCNERNCMTMYWFCRKSSTRPLVKQCWI